MHRRVFLLVLDSVGMGGAVDAADFGDEGAHTLRSAASAPGFAVPTLGRLGLWNICGMNCGRPDSRPLGAYGRLQELSRGKDTTIGHWELAGLVSSAPLPTFPEGFPEELLEAMRKATGLDFLCNRPYSGTQVIQDYGRDHLQTGSPILYTSADSVLQLAVHTHVMPLPELYALCRTLRSLLNTRPEWSVGRVIARPFSGMAEAGFVRISGRHDYSLHPPAATMLDVLQQSGLDTLAVGKIWDIFDGAGISRSYPAATNEEGMQRTLSLVRQDFHGLVFVNLVDFDMLYGHRRDAAGYGAALTAFDGQLACLMEALEEDDLLLVTADHGCDPLFAAGTDHTREDIPLLAYGKHVLPGYDMGIRQGFSHVARLVCRYLGADENFPGDDLWTEIQMPSAT